MKLYSYWRSSAAYRVRIVLNLKGLVASEDYQIVPVSLLDAEHQSDEYLAINPTGLVPALQLDDGRVLTQSTAIIEWLDTVYPHPALQPQDAFERARVMSWVQIIACEIHPLNNIGVMNFLKSSFSVEPSEVVTTWYYYWLRRGFDPLEKELSAAPYCYGETPTIADAYLIPQVYNAMRFKFDFTDYPKIMSIWDTCNQLDAFQRALPEHQPDAN
jgi:maleylacetoacetate isomerase